MKGKIKRLFEEACPLHVVIAGELYIPTNSIHSLLTSLSDADLPVSVSIKSTNSLYHAYGMEDRLCRVIFEYDKE